MAPNRIAFVDRDGVLRREKLILPGVPELFAALHGSQIRAVVLSNGSRERGADVQKTLRSWGVQEETLPQAVTSADATARYLVDHPSSEHPRACVVGEQGIRSAVTDAGIPIINDQWDGSAWETRPTDVVVGFDKKIDYPQLSGAFNAIANGARFVATNGDKAYRNEHGEVMPANGAVVRYLSAAREPEAIIGKPSLTMPLQILDKLRAKKSSTEITVIGDSLDEDIAMADALCASGWNVRRWLVLSGLTSRDDLQKLPPVDRVFEDIREITSELLR